MTIERPFETTFDVIFDSQREALPDVDGGEIIDLAADVNPRTQHHVLHQRHIGEPQDLTGMDLSLVTIYRFGFTNVGEIVEKHGAVDRKGRNPERAPARKRPFARRQTIARWLGWGNRIGDE